MEIKHREFLKVSTHTCHASTLAFYKNKPIYAWFGGSREGMPDCAIYIQSDDKIYSIGKKDHMPRWNPILFPYEDRLFLFIKIGLFCDRWNSLIYDISDICDDDFNINKVIPQILPAGLNGPVKTKPICFEGEIYCGSSVETLIDWTSYIEVYKIKGNEFVLKSRSSPLTVSKQIYLDKYLGRKAQTLGIIQPSLWVDKNNKLNAFFRSSYGLEKIYHSQNLCIKNNLWTSPVSTQFENPNSSVDTVFADNRLFLVYNPSSESRIPLVLSELDDQFNEKDRLVIRDKIDEKDVTYSQELSYPYLIECDKKLYLGYTYGRSKIECVEIAI